MKKSKLTKMSKQFTAKPQFFPRQLSADGDIIVKRLTFPGTVLSTGGSTIIPVTSVTSSQVQSAPATEWASFSARYQQYRVRAIRVKGKAINPVQSYDFAAGSQVLALSHSVLYRGDYLGIAVPANSSQLLSDELVKENTTNKDFSDTVNWKRNPNAMLWNPTSAAIPAANQYSWVCASPATPPLTTATTYYALILEWEVEFRGSQ
jgi:hypothetical protein